MLPVSDFGRLHRGRAFLIRIEIKCTDRSFFDITQKTVNKVFDLNNKLKIGLALHCIITDCLQSVMILENGIRRCFLLVVGRCNDAHGGVNRRLAGIHRRSFQTCNVRLSRHLNDVTVSSELRIVVQLSCKPLTLILARNT